MRILELLGTWVAGIGTFAAVGVALWLARRSEKIKLEARVGHRLLIGNGVREECLDFDVTNLGERPVTINSIGWRIGKKKNRQHSIQTLTRSTRDNYPKKIEYGENALFMVEFKDSPDWFTDFVERIIADYPLETLREQIHTSVGYTKVIKPERIFLKKLEEAQRELR